MDMNDMHPTVLDFIGQVMNFGAFERDGWGNIRFIVEK